MYISAHELPSRTAPQAPPHSRPAFAPSIIHTRLHALRGRTRQPPTTVLADARQRFWVRSDRSSGANGCSESAAAIERRIRTLIGAMAATVRCDDTLAQTLALNP